MSGGAGHIHAGTHILPLRVYYEDTDAAGMVYYANYLRYAERGRTEMLRQLGINQSETSRRYGMSFAVRDCRIAYRRPARLDDRLELRSRLTEMGGATLRMTQEIWRDQDELTQLELRIACIATDGRAMRLPGPLRELLIPYLQGSQ